MRHTQKIYMAEMIVHEVGDNELVRDSQRSMPVPVKIIGVDGYNGDQSYLRVQPNDSPPYYTFNFRTIPLKPSMPVIYSNNNRSTYATIISYDDSTEKFTLDLNGDKMSDIALNSIYGVGKYADDTGAEFGDASADFNNCMKIRINEDVTFRDTALDKPATVLLAHNENTYDIQVNGEAEARTSVMRDRLIHKALQYDAPHVTIQQPTEESHYRTFTHPTEECEDLQEPLEDEGLPAETNAHRKKARKISGIGSDELVEEVQTNKTYSKRFEDNDTSEKLQAYMDSGCMLKQFPNQSKARAKGEDILHKLHGPDNDKSTIAFKNKLAQSNLHKAATIVMRKQELPRCIANGMEAKFQQLLDMGDFCKAKTRELHKSGSTQDIALFFEDVLAFATLAQSIKSVYCDIPQARFVAQEKLNCLRVHDQSLEQTNDPFALRPQTSVQHRSSTSVAGTMMSAIGGVSGFANGQITAVFQQPYLDPSDSDDDNVNNARKRPRFE